MKLLWLGIAAGAFQVLGYILYIRGSLRNEISPNAASWFMFSYGTALLGVLEFSRGAEIELLILPALCATLSIFVAALCWRRGTLHWPKEWQDQLAFVADVALTIAYFVAWSLAAWGALSEEGRGHANLTFLVLSNLTTMTSFAPLIRGVKSGTARECSGPWVAWACAYTLLVAVTFAKEGFWTDLMMYPALNVYLHWRVAWLASRR